jgi:DNA repair exonuclease SbcCD nuclease subunit
MTRLIHTGDTHLGYQQYHLPERRRDFLDAFQQVADDAVDEGIDAVVHAGDLFHDRRPTLPDIMGALSVLRTLDDADVPFLAIVGNHESKRDAQWLDLFESLGLATRLGREPVAVGDVALYGLDFVPRARRADVAYDFVEHAAEHAVLVSHGLFQPFDHGDRDAREILASADVRFDALLLGDDHEPQTRRVTDPHETWLTYCGSTERASADERADRSYNLVTVDDGVDIRRRGLDTREFVFVRVELGAGEGIGRVRERVSQHDLGDAVVVVHIDGEGEPVTPAAVEAVAEEGGALTARVTDRRELADESDVEVSFANPDDAVRERLRELGLSPAARDIDETIRASTVADSNVADAVEDRITEIVADADDGAFDPAPEAEEGDADEETTAGTSVADDGEEGDDQDGQDSQDDQVTMEDYL